MNHESDHTVDAAKKELNADLLELFEDRVENVGVRVTP